MGRNAIWKLRAAALSVALFGLSAAPAGAAEQITLGTVGQASANVWPVLIALDQGFYKAEDLKVDIVYVQSSAALVQQVTAGSVPVSISTGLADPLRAVGMGAPVSIARIEVQLPPYDLVAKPGIKSLADLKGKLISLGGPKDITRIYVDRMLAPSGVKDGEFDMVSASAPPPRAPRRSPPAPSMPQFCSRRSIFRQWRRASGASDSQQIMSKTCRSPA